MKAIRSFFVFFILILALYPKTAVRASDLTDMQTVTEITLRMLNGLPTSLEEQLGVSAPCLFDKVSGGTGCIIIGDSRITAMNAACRVNATPDNWFAIACAGTHMNYLSEVAIPAAELLEAAHPEITHWKYIINMGLTDLDKAKSYSDYLSALSVNKDVYFVSVNPTSKTVITGNFGLTNKRIAAFNSVISSIPSVKYIDTYAYLMQTGYNTVEDGFHYDPDTTRRIYQAIRLLVG